MKSSLPPSTPEEDLAFIEKCCPAVFDEDEVLLEEEDDDDECMEHARGQALDEHFAMKAYGFVPRTEQQEIVNRFSQLRGVLSEEFCEARARLDARRRGCDVESEFDDFDDEE